MEITELTNRFLKTLNYLIKNSYVSDNKSFAKSISISASMITEIVKERSNVGLQAIQNTVLKYPINPTWLLTGQGEMILTSTKENTNYISGGNNMTGNVNGGQMLNISIPESGTQKIIKPSGEIEIHRTDSMKSENEREVDLLKENSDLKEKIAFLEGTIKGKDDLIANLQKTIEMLCKNK